MDKKLKKENEQEEIRGIDASSIEILNDDCLVAIFQHLPMPEKILIERVSKRWQTLSKLSWSNITCLDFFEKDWGLKRTHYEKKPFVEEIGFHKIISLCGRRLRSISTDIINFSKIRWSLMNLRELQLHDECFGCRIPWEDYLKNPHKVFEKSGPCTEDYWPIGLVWLICHGKNMTKFEIKVGHCYYRESHFAKLLREMKQLKSFSMYRCDLLNLSGNFLFELPFDTIQELILTGGFEAEEKLPFDNILLSLVIEKCKKLQRLCIGTLNSQFIFYGISYASFLKSLKLNFWYGTVIEESAFSKISALTQLEKLDVSYSNCVTDKFLKILAENCKKLTYLDITGCYEVTDDGFSSICNLEKLNFLNISETEEIKNPPLEKLTSLVVLEGSFSMALEEECLCTFLGKANQLRALNVPAFYFISGKLLNAATELTKKRKSNISLDLYIDGKVENDGITQNLTTDQEPPLVNIIRLQGFPLFGDVPLSKYGIEQPYRKIKLPEICTTQNDYPVHE